MARPRLHLPPAELVARGLRRLRDELTVPDRHPPEAVDAARRAVDGRSDRLDLRDVPFVTIDPVGSRDLDQAYWAARRGDGFLVRYAIADVAAFVRPDDPVDVESWKRAVTLYPPDGRVPLHPAPLSEDAGSLLAGVDRPALVWELHLDGDGVVTSARLEAATVRSRAQLSYVDAQRRIDGGSVDDDDPVALLPVIGALREQLEIDRGGIHLPLPSQEVVAADGRFDLAYEVSLPVEEWNAHISLMTGLAAAQLLGEAGAGLLRTLPTARRDTIDELRRTADCLGIDWPADESYPAFIRRLDAAEPTGAALLTQARSVFRGADYETFTGPLPPDAVHAAIGGHYAHVTAPLRRLCDRFSNEILVAHCADREPPAWAVEALERLPKAMARGRSLEGRLDRGVIDLVEAVLLSGRVGERLRGAVVGERKSGVVVSLRDPAIVGVARGEAELGAEVAVTVEDADPEAGRVELRIAAGG
ncbi:MAG: RNB domain-containing ribonuclease [Actinomycetota bacterium]